MLRRVVPNAGATRFSATASLVAAGAAAPTTSARALSQASLDAVAKGLAAEGSFNADFVQRTVAQFKAFQLPDSYEKYFTPAQIQEHVCAFMSAKTGDPAQLDFAREREKYAFYWCEDSFTAQLDTIKLMEDFAAKQLAKYPGHGVSVSSYSSRPKGGSERNAVFFSCQLFRFLDASGNKPDLAGNATAEFLTRKRDAAKARYANMLEELRSSIGPVFNISEPLADGTTVFTVAVNDERLGQLSAIVTMLAGITGARVERTFAETFANKAQVYSIFVSGCKPEDLRRIGTNFGLLPKRPRHPLMEAYRAGAIGYEQVVFGHAMMIFCQYFTPAAASDDFAELQRALKNDEPRLKRLIDMRSVSNQELVTDDLAGKVLAANPELVNALFADFNKGSTAESIKALQALIDTKFKQEPVNHGIMSTCLRFVASIRRNNFFRAGRAAVCYRLDPKIVLQGMDFPRIPYGIYFVVGSDFRGFHIRFHDIARGGIRLIVSQSNALHAKNVRTLFQENYGLAHTQMLKNKDIPESGSKGTILVSMRCPRSDIHYKRNFMQYIDSVLDNMLESEGVRDTLKQKEILFLGPDERTAGEFPTIAALHAKKRGFPMWKSLTTGKSPSIGGIPHDVDGMTTRSVRCYVNGLYKKLGIDGTKLTKFMTGGPDGDLGSNELIFGTEKVRGMCDGTAAIIDPDCVDVQELLRLVKEKKPLEHFNRAKLGPKTVFKLVDDKTSVTGPDGEVYANGEDFRNRLHFHPWAACPTFVPCGGRPAAVTLSNVHLFLVHAPGITGDMMLAGAANAKVSPDQLRFKYIVEGANLFITQDARLALENCGVQLFKDSSANKGGVTSSSVEVYTGLALSDAQHAENMCVKDAAKPPAFYTSLKKDIIARVEANATMEFEAIWKDSQKGCLGGTKTLISDALSRKIVNMVEFIQASTLHEDRELFRYVIHGYTPKTLMNLVSLDEIFERVPISYLRAIFAKTIASHFVYAVGVDANEFAFFEYMRTLLKKSHEWNAAQKK